MHIYLISNLIKVNICLPSVTLSLADLELFISGYSNLMKYILQISKNSKLLIGSSGLIVSTTTTEN